MVSGPSKSMEIEEVPKHFEVSKKIPSPDENKFLKSSYWQTRLLNVAMIDGG